MSDVPAPLVFPLRLDDFGQIVAALEQDAGRLLDGLDDELVNWKPADEAWSVAQCLDHLARTTNGYLDALERALGRGGGAGGGAGERQVVRPGPFSRWFIRQMEPPVKLRFPAPRKIVPAPRLGRDEVARAFGQSLERLRDILGQVPRVDVNGVRFTSPFGPMRLSVGAALAVIVAHDRRHLCQAWDVRRASGVQA